MFDNSEPVKQKIATQLIQHHGNRGELVLSTQVLQEFFITATRKLATPLFIDIAYQVVDQFSFYDVVQINPALILKAIRRHQTDSFSFWDSLIVEAALSASCIELYSEDMQSGRRIDNMVIQNPFLS